MSESEPPLSGYLIPRQTPAEVVARLEAERAGAGGEDMILAFDADGTLWEGDVGLDLFEALLRDRTIRPAARDALAQEARELGLPFDGDENELGEALFGAYNAHRYAADRAFAMQAWVFAGWHRDEVAAFAGQVARLVGIEARIRRETAEVVAWAAEAGVDVYVVSASPCAMVRVCAARLGIEPDHVLAMTPAHGADGVLVAAIAGPVVYGGGKMEALERVRPAAILLGAFGDSDYDAPMLRAARVRVAVAPSPRLLRLAATIPGMVVLSR
jgi:phosphatidylglycerophosphatase C